MSQRHEDASGQVLVVDAGVLYAVADRKDRKACVGCCAAWPTPSSSPRSSS